GYRLYRVAFANFVMGGGSGVGAGVGLLAGSDGDDQTGFGLQRFASILRAFLRTSGRRVEVVRFGYCFGRGVVGAGDGGQSFSGLDFVIAPPDSLVGGDRGYGGFEFVGGSGGQVELERPAFSRLFWRSQTQQARVQVEQIGGGGVDAFGG